MSKVGGGRGTPTVRGGGGRMEDAVEEETTGGEGGRKKGGEDAALGALDELRDEITELPSLLHDSARQGRVSSTCSFRKDLPSGNQVG